MSDRRKIYFTCLKCSGRQFKGIRLVKNQVNESTIKQSREAINQFFLEWIITPEPIL